jgi:hypothetical protein
VAHRAPQPLGHLAQQHVAQVVAHRVVEQLEVVEVEVEQGAVLARAPAARQHVFQLLDQEAAVRQAGQVVEIGQFVDMPFGALALGEVGVHARDAHGLAGSASRST